MFIRFDIGQVGASTHERARFKREAAKFVHMEHYSSF